MYIVFMLFKHAKNLEIQSYFGVNFTRFGGGLQTLRFLRLCFIDYAETQLLVIGSSHF